MSREKRKLTEAQVERRNAVLDTLKSLIFPVVLVAILGIGVYLIIHFVNVEEEAEPVQPYGFEGDETPIVMETDSIKFEMDPLTTLFTITQKKTGKVWSSFITDTDKGKTQNISQDVKNRMQSNVILSYAVTAGLETVLDSKAYSVDKSVYEIESTGDNELTVHYSLGDISREFIIPPVMRQADFDAYRANMEKNKADAVKDAYKLYDLKKIKKQEEKDEILEKYPIISEGPIYVLRDTTKDNRKQTLEGAFEAAGYTYEQYLIDKELDKSEGVNTKPVFNLDMIFRVEGSDLIVEIPFKSIEYGSKTPVYTITPLPYFGAASVDDQGFMFVPEGGGAIINYNNGKVSQTDYYANLYGWDMDLRREYVIHNTRAYFNTFGQSCGDSSYLCILEDGSSYAAVQAKISGREHGYNFVDAKYSLCSREKYDVGTIAASDVFVYLDELPQDESIIQRYRFIDKSDYVDMAYTYRAYLEKEYGQYMSLNNFTEAPITVELIGAIDKKQQILGIPMSLPLKLTSYKDAGEIIRDLSDEGLGNLSVKLVGWCNGGVSQKILKNIRTINALGTSADLKNLCETARNNGVDLYLDGITQYEHNSNIFNGFFSYRDAARFLTKERAELFHFSHVTYKARQGFKSYYLLHTPLAMKMANNLVDYSVKKGAGVSFQDIGMDLSSDFYRKATYSREDTKKLNEDLLKSLDDKGAKLMINMGNDYAVPYADVVTNMDLKGSGYTVIDEEVPFYQIAVHGYINYTGDPINACGNDEEELLRSVEYGAGLNFALMSESSFALQKTLYPEYYGCEYASWRSRMIEMCNRYNDELGHTFNQEMTDHDVISPYVRCTTYADGTKVYVNYSFAEDYTAPDGTVVGARDYAVVK